MCAFAALAAAPFVWMHLLLLIARVQLGRWPHRGGLDDPKGIPLVSDLYGIGMMVLMLWPLGVLGMIGVCVGMWKRSPRRGAIYLLTAVSAVFLPIFVERVTNAGVWLAD